MMSITRYRHTSDDVLSASAICTPAIAEGLSNRTSALLHASQESARSKERIHVATATMKHGVYILTLIQPRSELHTMVIT